MNAPQRPTFTETIKALTLTHPDYGVLHTEEEADVAEVLRHVEAEHQGADHRDAPGLDTWGLCAACREPWPCRTWNDAEQLAVIYLGRAQDRVWDHARAALARLRTALVLTCPHSCVRASYWLDSAQGRDEGGAR